MKTLIIIPTYNEIENIKEIITTILSLNIHFNILVVDDNSPDNTANLVETLQIKHKDRLFLLKRSGKLGLGTAYIMGFKWGLERGFDYFIEMDADFSHNPNDILRLLAKAINDNYDVVIGSRNVKGGKIIGWPFVRLFYSKGGSLFSRIITFMPIKDTTAGFVCYHRTVLEKMNLNNINQIGYGFQIEMKFLAWKLGFKIAEIPIIFKEREKGTSKMNSNIIYEALLNVLKMQWQFLTGRYLKNKKNK